MCPAFEATFQIRIMNGCDTCCNFSLDTDDTPCCIVPLKGSFELVLLLQMLSLTDIHVS